jgi:hypothetical protein
VAGLREFGLNVVSLVPTGFAGYARVFHPALRLSRCADAAGPSARQISSGDNALWETDVRWSTVAAANQRAAHLAMEWASITGSWEFFHGSAQPGVWDTEPETGGLPAPTLCRLGLLRNHTQTPKVCWFALWDGWGDLTIDRSTPVVEMPQRPMFLFAGSLNALATEPLA